MNEVEAKKKFEEYTLRISNVIIFILPLFEISWEASKLTFKDVIKEEDRPFLNQINFACLGTGISETLKLWEFDVEKMNENESSGILTLSSYLRFIHSNSDKIFGMHSKNRINKLVELFKTEITGKKEIIHALKIYRNQMVMHSQKKETEYQRDNNVEDVFTLIDLSKKIIGKFHMEYYNQDINFIAPDFRNNYIQNYFHNFNFLK